MVANDFKVKNAVFNAASKGSSEMIGHFVKKIHLYIIIFI